MSVLALVLLVAPPPVVPPPRWRPPPSKLSSVEVAEAAEVASAKGLGLRRKGRGYQRVREAGDRFDAFIRPDGQVEFKLDREVRIKPDGVCGFAVCLGGEGERSRARTSGARGRGLGLVALIGEAVLTGTARVGSWGYGTPRGGPLFDRRSALPPSEVSEHLASAVGRYGHLPAPVADMSKFMDETLGFRTELARRSAQRRFDEARQDLRRSVAAVWASERSSAQKRAALLGIWSDLDAPAPTRDAPLEASLDELRRVAAAAARAIVLTSARAHAPQGSPDAFTRAELAAFNAQTPIAFCPYGDAGCPRPVAPTSAESTGPVPPVE